MGNCQYGTGDNSAPNLSRYVDIPVDGTFEHPGYCDYIGTNNVNCGDNGEFQAFGEGDGKCTCKGLCNDGCRRKTCRRIEYSGSIDKCCELGGPDYYMDGNTERTCNPIYRQDMWQTRKSCDDKLRIFCLQGNNAFTTDGCKRWFTINQQNEKVDQVMKEICRRPENANKRECACILETDRISRDLLELPPNQRTIPPYCMAPECVTNLEAWKVSDQHKPCETVYCGVNINRFQQTGANPSVIIKQECGNRPTTGGGIPIDSEDINPDPTSDDPIKEKTFFQKYGIYIIASVILLILIILIGYGVYSAD